MTSNTLFSRCVPNADDVLEVLENRGELNRVIERAALYAWNLSGTGSPWHGISKTLQRGYLDAAEGSVVGVIKALYDEGWRMREPALRSDAVNQVMQADLDQQIKNVDAVFKAIADHLGPVSHG